MFYQKNKNSKPHNWLIHHNCILSVKRNAVHIKKRVLDIGCGIQPYRKFIEEFCDEYFGLEHPKTLHGLEYADVAGDALAIPFKNETFDSIVSFQVMEHVPEPQIFLSETIRILKRGGKMLLTTPFMWGEHESPHDYYRYTRYGLQYLAKKSGFEVISIEPDTGYWATAVLRFNYWLNRLAKGPLRYLVMPIWLNQYIAMLLDKVDSAYTVDTASFTSLLRKPE